MTFPLLSDLSKTKLFYWLRKLISQKNRLCHYLQPQWNSKRRDKVALLEEKKKKKNEYEEVHIQQTGIMLPPWPVSATTERTASLIFSCVLSFSSRLHPWEVSAKLTCFFLLLLFNRLLDLTFYFNVRHGLQRKIAYLLPPTVLMLFLLSVTGKHFNSYIKNHVARIIMCMFAHIKYMQNNISRQVVTLLNLAQCCALPVSSHLSPLY